MSAWLQTWWGRCLVKCLIGAVGTLFVLFPRIDRAVLQLARLADSDALIEPQHPALAAINAEISAKLPPGCPPQQEVQLVQTWVYEHVKYRYDWVLWGNLDYWPTVSEVLEKREEDCDGRAVLAASLLRGRGFTTAHLVGNLSHVWVALAPDDPRAKPAAPAASPAVLAAMNPIGQPAFARAGGSWKLNLPEWSGVRPALQDAAKFPAVRVLAIALLWLGLALWPARRWGWFGVAAACVMAGLVIWQSWAARSTFAGSGASDAELLFALALVLAGFAIAVLADRLETLRFLWHALRGAVSTTRGGT